MRDQEEIDYQVYHGIVAQFNIALVLDDAAHLNPDPRIVLRPEVVASEMRGNLCDPGRQPGQCPRIRNELLQRRELSMEIIQTLTIAHSTPPTTLLCVKLSSTLQKVGFNTMLITINV